MTKNSQSKKLQGTTPAVFHQNLPCAAAAGTAAAGAAADDTEMQDRTCSCVRGSLTVYEQKKLNLVKGEV